MPWLNHAMGRPRARWAWTLLLAAWLSTNSLGKVPLQEKLALIDLKTAMQPPGRAVYMNDWLVDTDPCENEWQGIVCDCVEVAFSLTADNDCAHLNASNVQHVYGIWLQRARGANLPALQGYLPQSMVNLTELRSVGFTNQRIEVVDVLWDISTLEGVTISSNGVVGNIANINITNMPGLQFLFLSNNRLEGPVPDSWCQDRNQALVIDLRNNSGLCGLDESCFRSIKNSSVYTHDEIIVNADNSDPAYCCDIQRPSCNTPGSCSVEVPPYWTNESSLTVNFTNFDNPSNASLVYTTFCYCFALVSNPSSQIYQVLSNDVCRVQLTDSNLTAELFHPETTEFPNGVTQLTYQLTPGIAASGSTYEVGVSAAIEQCPSRTKWASDNDGFMKASFQAPRIAEVFNTAEFVNQAIQTQTDFIGMSWTTVFDPDGVPCCNMSMQIVQHIQSDYGNYTNVTTRQDIPDEYAQRRSYTYPIQLDVDEEYVVILVATNAAGQSSWQYTTLMISSTSSNLSPGVIALIVLMSLFLAAMIAGVVALLVARHREQERVTQAKRTKAQLAKFRNFIRTINMQQDHGALDLDNPSHVAFVITDLENSTACAAADRHAYRDVQVVHDQIMRELIARFGGYEVNTEGDSFQVAFPTVGAAVQWCMEVQRALLETVWPRRVTRLPSCSREVDIQGRVLFNGPRVRMGIHWASADTFIIAEHPETELKVFKGRGWELAHEVGDIGWGGQVLLTEQAWGACQANMAAAGFPIVRQLGLFKLKHWLQPMWLYEVGELLGRPLGRIFAPLPKSTPLVSTTRRNLVQPPVASLSHLQDAMVQRVLLPKTSSDGKGASSDDGTSSTTEGDEAAATNAPAPTVANGEPPPSQQHPRQDTAVAESAWAPPPHGITVRSFIRTAVGSRSLKQRLEALRHRAHTGRWDDAILQPDGQLTFVVARLEPWALQLVPPGEGALAAAVESWDSPGQVDGWNSVKTDPSSLGGLSKSALLKRASSVSYRNRGSLRQDLVESLPPGVLSQIRDVFSVMAQQFRGYIFRQEYTDGLVFGLAFDDPLDAVRCAHGAQHLLMLQSWPTNSAHILGPKEETADGMPIYYGPRFAMVAHQSADFTCHSVGIPLTYQGEVVWPQDLCYLGRAPCLARRLVESVHGGQVVVTNALWKSIQDHVPAQVEVLDCGTYSVPGVVEPQNLTQLLPQMLSARSFVHLKGCALLSKGFIHSPHPDAPVAICFAKVDRPAAVERAFASDVDATSDDIADTLTAFYSGVTLLERVVRDLLEAFDGYECKSPEPGKFTLAFSNLELAVSYCCAVQLQLLDLPWPAELLQWAECAPMTDSEDGRLLFRGLRLRMGVTWGLADSRKPLNTGRADYFGSVANMAARIMVTARPGQVFVQGTSSLVSLGNPLPPDVLQSLTNGRSAGADASAMTVQERHASRMSDTSLNLAGSMEADGHSMFASAVSRFRTASRDDPSQGNSPSLRGVVPQQSIAGCVPGAARYIGADPTADSTLLLIPLGRFKLKGFPDGQVLFDVHPWALRHRTFDTELQAGPWAMRDLRAATPRKEDSSGRGVRRLIGLLSKKGHPWGNTNGNTSDGAACRTGSSGSGSGAMGGFSPPSTGELAKEQAATRAPRAPGQGPPSATDLAAMLCSRDKSVLVRYAPLSEAQVAAARQVAQLYVQGRDGCAISVDEPTVLNDTRLAKEHGK